MRPDYDLAINTQGDITYIEGPDIQTIDSAALVAQDIRRVLEFPLGALLWSPDTGSVLHTAINTPTQNALIEQEMLRIAQADARIDQTSISITYTIHNTPVLRFTVLGSTTQQEVTL